MNVALRPEPLNILSICTGGAGLDLGVELAIPSARTVCMVEREAFSVATLVSAMEQGLLHPAPVWSDARTFDGRAWRGAVDGLIGGIPCQPHSLAGRKQGSNDARDLWSTARRIIVQSRAWFVVIENVGGMLSAGSDEIAGAQRVFRDLHKLGFQVEGGLFTASEVGASHQRERIIILAVADSDNKQRRGQYEFSCGARQGPRQQPDRDRDGVPGVGQADAYGERLEGVGADDRESRWENARRSLGLCDRATVVDPASIGRGEGRTEPEFRGWGQPLPSQAVQWSTPSVADVQGGRKTRSGDRNSELLMNGQADQLSSRLDQTISTVGETSSTDRRSLNPLFVEWLMGWPPGWTLLAWTDFACSATELSLFKQRMRSALLSLGLPREAPPAQLALFG